MVINFNDVRFYLNLLESKKIHRLANYDFTFENRFIIYHYQHGDRFNYVAFDKTTGLGSIVCKQKNLIKANEYPTITDKILFSIKYTGDRRFSKCK